MERYITQHDNTQHNDTSYNCKIIILMQRVISLLFKLRAITPSDVRLSAVMLGDTMVSVAMMSFLYCVLLCWVTKNGSKMF